jgi:DNA-directed RNA polymerase specialized sigma24 family protein
MVARRRLIRCMGKSERSRSAGRGSASRQQLENLPLAERAEVSKAAEILDGMNPEQRQVIELSLCEGYSQSDITNRLHLAPGAVQAHLRKGLLAVGVGGAQPI